VEKPHSYSITRVIDPAVVAWEGDVDTVTPKSGLDRAFGPVATETVDEA
jgi:hypothetical protein